MGTRCEHTLEPAVSGWIHFLEQVEHRIYASVSRVGAREEFYPGEFTCSNVFHCSLSAPFALSVLKENLNEAGSMSGNEQWQKLPSDAGEGAGDLACEHRNTSPSLTSSRDGTFDPLWTPEQVAERLNVSPDWVRDHSSRKEPRLPVIRLGGGPGRAGLLRYRASAIEKFIEEMERLSRRNYRRI